MSIVTQGYGSGSLIVLQGYGPSGPGVGTGVFDVTFWVRMELDLCFVMIA